LGRQSSAPADLSEIRRIYEHKMATQTADMAQGVKFNRRRSKNWRFPKFQSGWCRFKMMRHSNQGLCAVESKAPMPPRCARWTGKTGCIFFNSNVPGKTNPAVTAGDPKSDQPTNDAAK